MKRHIAGLSMLTIVAAGAAVTVASGDIDPVRITTISAPSKVNVGARATIKVTVDADSGAFDVADPPIKVRAKLAPRCASSFDGTNGRVAVDAVLTPQPSKGGSLHAVATGKPRLTKRETYQLCVYVTDSEDRQYATDVDRTLTVRKKPAKHKH